MACNSSKGLEDSEQALTSPGRPKARKNCSAAVVSRSLQ